MIALLLGSHLFFTFKTGFIQRKLPMAIKLIAIEATRRQRRHQPLRRAGHGAGGHHRHRLHRGRGHAILAGGPGAVFWMWITGVFGIATKYAEVYAAVKYRVRDHNGAMLGGAMYIFGSARSGATPRAKRDPSPAGIPLVGEARRCGVRRVRSHRGHWNWFGRAGSAMSGIITSNVDVPAGIVGVIIVVLVSVVIFGGVQSISKVYGERLVPHHGRGLCGRLPRHPRVQLALIGDARWALSWNARSL